jgi:regulator of sirC expression with transglutaminase-like and TPR domain
MSIEKEEMLQQIRCCDFAINELALYLDTHPTDDNALCILVWHAKSLR